MAVISALVDVDDEVLLIMSSDVGWHIRDKLRPVPIEAWFNIALRPRKPEASR